MLRLTPKAAKLMKDVSDPSGDTAKAPQLISEPARLHELCRAVRRRGARVGLVPTMGALHDGHLDVMRRASRVCDVLVVTVFVNPTQFGPGEDLSRYPRDLDADLDKCQAIGADAVFAPPSEAMYLHGEQTRVSVGAIADTLCGAARPGHFAGVCTVVSKLFNLVGPCVAAFGKKDYQQLKIIERMVADLFFPVELLPCPTVREPSGLALSSRNRYLSEQRRQDALGIARGLNAARRLFETGQRDRALLELACKELIEGAGLTVDYVTLTDPETLQPIPTAGERALLAVAAYADQTRLIDNLVLGSDPVIVLGAE